MIPTDSPHRLPGNGQIDCPRLSAYLRSGIPGLTGEAELWQFPAGHSNLTYLVRFASRELVLKQAPPGHRARSAHDMGREFRMLAKLQGRYPYAPLALMYCDDPTIVGSPFCVMERAEGVIIRQEYPEAVTAEQVRLQFEHLLDALADLHSIDVASANLGDLGRPIGYRSRQIAGWSQRLAAAATDGMADFGEITAWLVAHLPREPEVAAVVHNDFKLDNLVWRATDITTLRAVLDWEMSTVGDPALDLACTLSFWVQDDDPAEFRAIRAMPSAGHGVLTREQAVNRYSRRARRDLPPLDFLLCFGFFRRAVIEQQKYFRYMRGDSNDSRFSALDRSVNTLREMCLGVIRRDLKE